MPPPPGYIYTPSEKQPTRSANDTAEYRRNYVPSEYINLLYAFDNGWTGKGVTVGVVDDGVNVDLDAFLGHISDLSKDFGSETRNGVTTARNKLGDQNSDHGTSVAAILAEARDGKGTQGVAPDASIAVLRVSANDYDKGTEVLMISNQLFDYATANKIPILNMSLGSDRTTGFKDIQDAVTRYGASGGLIVKSAGNASGANPQDSADVTDENRDTWIFVVALHPSPTNYELASYSNNAGNLMDRAVAAPGSNITIDVNGNRTVFSGTSSAAPMVSGLAALILSKWPQLTGKEAGSVILNTAKDIGDPGVDAVFGRGLIDVKAALSPVNPTLSNGQRSTAVAGSVLVVPGPIGGAEAFQTALSSVTVLDEYGRDFTGSVAGMVIKPESGQGHWLRRRMDQMADGGGTSISAGKVYVQLGYAKIRFGPGDDQVTTTLTTGQLGYQMGRTGISVGLNATDSLQSDVMGLAPFANGTLAYAPQADTTVGVHRDTPAGRFGLTLGAGGTESSRARTVTASFDMGLTSLRASYIDEAGSVMGYRSAGGLALGRGATTAMIEAHQTVGIVDGWTLEGYGSLGVTRLKIDTASLVTDATPMVGTRYGLQTTGPAFGGMLSFGLAQPLTIESGTARLTVGNGYDLATRSLTYGDTSVGLAGERHLQLTTGFSKGGYRSSLRFGVMQDVTDGSTGALAGWSLRF